MNTQETSRPKVVSFNAMTATHDEAIDSVGKRGRFPYEVGRGLKTSSNPDGSRILGYNDSLPSFRGRNVETWIRQRLDEAQGPVAVMDVGYGRGIFLLDVAREFSGTSLVGYGRSEFAKANLPEQGVLPTYPELISKDIALIEGELPTINYENDALDVITINNVFQYLDEEQRQSSIKEAYRVLKKGGVAFISRVDLEDQIIRDALQELGVGESNYEIAESLDQDVQKTVAFQK